MCVCCCVDNVLCCLPLYYLCVCHTGAQSHTQSDDQHSPCLLRPLIFPRLLSCSLASCWCSSNLSQSFPWRFPSFGFPYSCPSILYLCERLCAISPGFASVSELRPKCHIHEMKHTIEWIFLLRQVRLYKPTNHTTSNFFFYYPSWVDLDHRDQQSYLFARQLGDSRPFAVFLAKTRVPPSVHSSQCSWSWQGEAVYVTHHFLPELRGAGVMAPWQKVAEDSSVLLEQCCNLVEWWAG